VDTLLRVIVAQLLAGSYEMRRATSRLPCMIWYVMLLINSFAPHSLASPRFLLRMRAEADQRHAALFDTAVGPQVLVKSIATPV
jgi:NAD-dependent oxidoreductase involved in siderophore biosynthesis